jgi:pimeloyl-ACP methyl ester carboxylesterase
MPFAPISGGELYYEVEGEEGPYVFFAHGGEGTHLHWWKQVVALRDEYRCVTFDARGFGQSTRTAGIESMGGQDDDLLALMDHVGAEQAFVVGHSMGGGAVSGVTQRHPERVTGLVMGDTPFGFATEALKSWAADMLDKIVNRGFDVTDQFFAPGFAEREPAMYYLFRGLSRLNPPRTGPRGLGAYEAMRDQAVVDYRDFPVPVLFIVGALDGLTVPPLIHATAAAIGGARVVEIPDAGHSAYCEQPDLYNETLRDFFRSVTT